MRNEVEKLTAKAVERIVGNFCDDVRDEIRTLAIDHNFKHVDITKFIECAAIWPAAQMLNMLIINHSHVPKKTAVKYICEKIEAAADFIEEKGLADSEFITVRGGNENELQ